MATTLLRTTVKTRLYDIIKAALPTVEVAYSYPGKTAPNEVIYFTNVEGTIEIAVMTGAGARKHRQDDFEIAIVVEVNKAGQTALQVEQRCEVLGAAIEDAFASIAVGPGLRLPTTLDGLQYGAITQIRGPESGPNPDGNGHRAMMEIIARFRTRLT